jgi:hypothetical protein
VIAAKRTLDREHRWGKIAEGGRGRGGECITPVLPAASSSRELDGGSVRAERRHQNVFIDDQVSGVRGGGRSICASRAQTGYGADALVVPRNRAIAT